MLLAFVAAYLVVSVAIGLAAALRVRTTADYALAGRAMPLPMVVATTFATWFGSETVLGVPAQFVEGGLRATVEDPWGASMCLVLVGLFFARPLYRMRLLTVGDYYHLRYGRAVEVICTLVSVLSYLGWVAAQVTALGLVFDALSGGAVDQTTGMVVGALVVLGYTVLGGMWSVALTDAVQMAVIVVGLLAIAWRTAALAGGAGAVWAEAADRGLFVLTPGADAHAWLFFIGSAITIMLGSIPQQDIFQRVMCARDERTASRGAVLGGLGYLAFAFVPMFIVAAAQRAMPQESAALLAADDPQRLLPTLVMGHMPLWLQVAFFGALLSAIMSTASATLLAPSTILVENLLKQALPAMSDRAELRAMRLTLVGFTLAVLAYALSMRGTPIYEQVSSSYQLPVVGAFVPLTAGLYWKRATRAGALASIALGVGTWVGLHATPWGEAFPPQLAGLLAALVGMVVGSLASPAPVGAPTGAEPRPV